MNTMKTFGNILGLLAACFSTLVCAMDPPVDKTIAAPQAPGYRVLDKVAIGGDGGWDYVLADTASRRLYIAHATHVVVMDMDTNKVTGNIPDTPGVHGVALAPELGRGFTSNGRANTSTIFDLKTLKPLGQVATGKNPDAILYDPASRKVFTFNGKSKDATVFNAATGTVEKTIPLGGKPEFAVADGAGKVYVNMEDTNQIKEIDGKNLTVERVFSLAPGEEPTGLAIDPQKHRLFAGCLNRLLAVVDTNTGKVIATPPIGGGVDATAFDPETGNIFASNGDGTLTVIRETQPGKFEVAETVKTQMGCRTIALDTKTHKVYLPTAEYEPVPEGSKKRPAMLKGSFLILIAGK